MEIKKLTLNNIGRFDRLEIHLAPLGNLNTNVTVFVGNNGSGKTSILRSLATTLSWLASRIQSESGKGSPIPELVIKNDKTSAALDIEVFHHIVGNVEEGDLESYDQNYFDWRIAKPRKGRKGEFKSDFYGATALADHYRTKLSEDERTALPLLAFYSVERVVIDIPLKIRGKHTFLQLDGYEKSLSQGVDFRRFFEWFREREDTENETGFSDEVLDTLKNILGSDQETWAKLKELRASKRDRQLTAVRSAIYKFMPEFSNLKVRRKPRLHMSIDKNGQPLDVAQLSQGEKSLMALIGDIARRLAVMNPALDNPLEGDGVVIIDEVDMHLHPKWQRTLISQLTSTFPNCQFVLTTHSPLVISDSKDILIYLIQEDGITKLSSLYGRSCNDVLDDVMSSYGKLSINPDVFSALERIESLISDQKYSEAKEKILELEENIGGEIPELVSAKLSIDLAGWDD